MKRKKLLCSGVAMLLSATVLMFTAAAEAAPTTQDQWENRDEPGTMADAGDGKGLQLTTTQKITTFAYKPLLTGDFTVSVDVTFPEDTTDGSVPPTAYFSLRNTSNNTWFLPRIMCSNGKVNYDASTLPDKKDWIHVINQGSWIENVGQTVTLTFAHKADSDLVVFLLSAGDKELARETVRDSSMTNDNFYSTGLEWALRNGEGGAELTFSNPQVSTTYDIEEGGSFTVPATTAASKTTTAASQTTGNPTEEANDNGALSPLAIGLIVGAVVIVAAAVVILLVVRKKKK